MAKDKVPYESGNRQRKPGESAADYARQIPYSSGPYYEEYEGGQLSRGVAPSAHSEKSEEKLEKKSLPKLRRKR